VTAQVGCGVDGDEASGSVPQEVAGPAPDYVVTSVSDPPAAALVGDAFSITATVENVGDAAATATSTTRYFLSPTATGPFVGALARKSLVPPLAVGAADTQSVALVMPRNVSSATYFLVACADRTRRVAELNEFNNCSASAATVELTGPDLFVESVSAPPATLLPGSTFSMTETIRNRGSAAAPASAVGHFLYTSGGVPRVRLLPRRSVPPLAPGDASTGSVVLEVPAVPPGSYLVETCADTLNKVFEIYDGKNNNCRLSTTPIVVPQDVDLAVTSLADPPTAVVAGEGFAVADTTANAGAIAAPATVTRFFLSLDALPGDDIPVLGSRMVPELPGSGASTGTTQITVDFATPPADYVLLACADARGALLETAETNNCRASASRVAVAEPEPADVTVELLGRRGWGGPAAGQPVLVHDRDGILVGRLATDAAGTAQATVPPGGSVTVLEIGPRRFTTFRGMRTGARLTAGDVGPSNQQVGSGALIVPESPLPDLAYVAQGPCAWSEPSLSTEIAMNLLDGCASTTPMMARLEEPNLGILRGYIFDPEVTLVPGGAAILDGDWLPPISFQARVTGIPVGTGVNVAVARFLGSQQFYYAGGPVEGDEVTLEDGVYTADMAQATGGDGLLTHIFVGHREIIDFSASTATSIERDVSSELVASSPGAQFLVGELEPGGPPDVVGMGWDLEEGASIDGMVLELIKVTPEDEAILWTVITPASPPGPNELRLPQLPDDLLGYWAGGMQNFVGIWTADTPASSFTEFSRDAEPLHHWAWIYLDPTPGTVRFSRSI
jgi:hypothetical protein